MMEHFFLHLLNMSLTAGVLVVVVMLLRLVFHKAPRWIHCLLWALVAVRLVCPFTIESNLSLMPDTPVVFVPAPTPDAPSVEVIVPDAPVGGTVTPTPDTPVVTPPVTDTPVVTPPVDPPVLTPTPDTSVSTATPEASVDPWQVALTVATWAWLAGVVVLAAYAVLSTLRLRRKVGEAAHLTANLWQCDHIRSPFILGVFRPRIYLPSDLSGGARDSVVAHEQAHLHRRDHWWKPLGFLLLTVYWFNPLMWVAYVFLCRDIEAACDERVVRDMPADARRTYSEALLLCSAPRRLVSACPLAFGETSVKSRVKSVLSYKKPTIWIIVAALLVSTVAGVCLLTDRPADKPDSDDSPAVTDGDDDSDSDDPTADAPAVGETVVVEAYNWMGEEELEKLFGYLPESNPALSSEYDALPVKVLYSRAELDAVLLSLREDRWQKHDFSAFDEDFFEDNHLVMTYYKAGTGTVQPTVGAYVYTEEGACLSVRLDVYQPYAGDTMLGEWLLFSGIQKKDMTGVTQKEAYVWRIIPTDHFIDVFDEPREQPETTMDQWYEREFLSDTQIAIVHAILHRLSEESGWQSAASVDRAFAFVGCVNVGAADYYVPSDFSALLSEDGMIGWLTAEESALLSEWFPKQNVSEPAVPTTSTTTGTTTTTPTTPTTPTKPTAPTTSTTTKAYWQTFSHPMPYEAAVGLTGGVELHQDSVEKLQKLVNTVSWNPWPEFWPDATILSSAFFSLDGETRYFVFDDFLYHENAPSDRCYARITDAQYEMLRDMHRGGVTAQATHTLRGYFAEWNKQAEFYELDVVQADDTSLIGKRVWVRTSHLPGAGIPYIGSLLEVSYDGVVVEWYQKSVYAIDYTVLKADEVTNATIPDSGTVNGKVIYVTDGAALMYFDDLEPYDTVFWVNYKAAYPDLNPQIGEMYRVVYDGLLCTTYPVQAVVQSMTEIDPPAISDKFISEDQAIELAAEYWGIEPGSKDMETAYAAVFYVMVMPTEKVPNYVIGLRYVDALYEGPANSTLFLGIHIDAETGEIWDAPID